MDNKLEIYKSTIKNNIETLVNEGNIIEAKELLREYENIVKDDVDVFSFRAVIAMMEGNLDEGEKALKEGLLLDRYNFDLLYNLAYLYQNKNEIDKSKIYYKRAFFNTEDKEMQKSIYEILESFGETKDLEYILNLKAIPNTSIVILTYNNLEYNKLCIESIKKYTKKGSYEIVVVDNNSTDGTREWLKEQKDIKVVLNNENLGFPKGCNVGINIANKENDVLLLNNDTITTPNWLENLKACLYSSNTIGAVGSVTNSCSNSQVISVQYTNTNEMIEFARSNNVSNEDLWEERLRLVGFCMLIKNDVVKEVGVLDERFTPGNFEDDDYSFRVRKAGYRLMLCKDSFIHHFGSVSFGKNRDRYNKLLQTNKNKFEKKWGFDPYYVMEIRRDFTQLIKNENKDNLNLLHIGCNGGGTLLDIKNNLPNANLYGIEPLSKVNVNTDHFADTITGDIKKINKFNKEYFDLIIITKTLESEEELLDTLKYIKDYIRSSGKAFISVNGEKIKLSKIFRGKLEAQVGNYYYNLRGLNNNQILSMEKTIKKDIKITKYNKFDLENMWDNNSFEDIDDKELINILIRRIDNHIELEKSINMITELIKRKVNIDDLKDSILKNSINKSELLNITGVICYQQNIYDKSIMLLKEAFKINPENKDTIYNIAFILYKINEYKAALDLLNTVAINDNIELLNLKAKIEEAI